MEGHILVYRACYLLALGAPPTAGYMSREMIVGLIATLDSINFASVSVRRLVFFTLHASTAISKRVRDWPIIHSATHLE